jgi:hypothetical protein
MKQVFAAIALNGTLNRPNRPGENGPRDPRRSNVPSHRDRG